MSKLEQAARQALEALEHLQTWPMAKEAITALREALVEQAEQEPVGEMIDKAGYKGAAWYYEPPETGTQLYAAPVRTKDLTDDELADACGWKLGDPMYEWVVDIGRWAIAADREKNK